MKQLVYNISQSQNPSIGLTTGDYIGFVEVYNIIRCQGERNYSHIGLRETNICWSRNFLKFMKQAIWILNRNDLFCNNLLKYCLKYFNRFFAIRPAKIPVFQNILSKKEKTRLTGYTKQSLRLFFSGSSVSSFFWK